MKKIILLLLCILSFLQAELYYEQWDQVSELTATTQKNKISVILRAELPERQYHNSWSYIFNYNSKIKINYVRLNSQPAKYTFINNELNIELGQLFDQQHCTLTFEYQEKNNNQNSFFIQQYISLPHWLKETPLNLKVILADGYLPCSRHPRFSNSKNIFFFTGKVPVNGLQELFIYTPRQSFWQIEKQYIITGTDSNKDFNFHFPKIGFTGDSEVISYLIESNQNPQKTSEQPHLHSYVFNDKGRIELTIKACLKKRPGEEKYLPPTANLLEVEPEVTSFLKTLSLKILARKAGKELPPHIKLAEWVHSYLTYDNGFAKKEQSVLQILESRRGVCKDYSKLYLQLCRAAKIPAAEVSGLAYSSLDPAGKPSWEAHSWVVVNVDSQWSPVDPTWNLTGGILPSSHLALYYPAEINYSYRAENYYGRLIVKEKINITEQQQ